MDLHIIKQANDILSLAEKAGAKFHRAGRGYVSHCPIHGGDNPGALNVWVDDNGVQVYKCQTHESQCNRYGYDVIGFIRALYGFSMADAVKFLGGDSATAPTLAERPRPQIKQRPDLPTHEFQVKTFKKVSDAMNRLERDANWQDARDFLTGRGLDTGILKMFNIGCGWAKDSKINKNRRAIYIPYIVKADEVISALKYRFIDNGPHPDAMRYTAEAGSRFTFPFGYQFADTFDNLTKFDYMPPAVHTALLLIEGEINAMSVCKYAPSGMSVLSFGSQSTIPKDIKQIASKYQRVFVWCDEAQRAREYQNIINRDAVKIFSPIKNGVKHDANQLLQNGELAEFIKSVFGVACENEK